MKKVLTTLSIALLASTMVMPAFAKGDGKAPGFIGTWECAFIRANTPLRIAYQTFESDGTSYATSSSTVNRTGDTLADLITDDGVGNLQINFNDRQTFLGIWEFAPKDHKKTVFLQLIDEWMHNAEGNLKGRFPVVFKFKYNKKKDTLKGNFVFKIKHYAVFGKPYDFEDPGTPLSLLPRYMGIDFDSDNLADFGCPDATKPICAFTNHEAHEANVAVDFDPEDSIINCERFTTDSDIQELKERIVNRPARLLGTDTPHPSSQPLQD